MHCVVVGVTRTGNVPEATAHGKLVEQFAAPRHANAAHLASNATISTATPTATPTAGNQVKTFHADPIQNEVTQNEVTQNAKRSDAKTEKNEQNEKYYFFRNDAKINEYAPLLCNIDIDNFINSALENK